MSSSEQQHAPLWVGRLLEWYDREGRDLPWRSDSEPYRIWLSEVMLQQTRVETVKPYYRRFVERFPTLKELADADRQEVLNLWEGLGYYRRARYLHEAAQKVIEEFDGQIPDTVGELQQLPGIGPYTSAAIASISFNQPEPPVDGNVLRVFARFWAVRDDVKKAAVRREFRDHLRPAFEASLPSDLCQAIMDLGATVCLPQNPTCAACPLEQDCEAHAQGLVAELPVRSTRGETPHYEVAVGVVWQEDRVLVARRKEDQMLGGMWEFPGGKRQGDEPLEQTVKRELREETGLEIQVESPYCVVDHAYSHFKITLTAYRCAIADGHAHPYASQEVRWARLSELDELPFPMASRRVIEAVRRAEQQRSPSI